MHSYRLEQKVTGKYIYTRYFHKRLLFSLQQMGMFYPSRSS